MTMLLSCVRHRLVTDFTERVRFSSLLLLKRFPFARRIPKPWSLVPTQRLPETSLIVTDRIPDLASSVSSVNGIAARVEVFGFHS